MFVLKRLLLFTSLFLGFLMGGFLIGACAPMVPGVQKSTSGSEATARSRTEDETATKAAGVEDPTGVPPPAFAALPSPGEGSGSGGAPAEAMMMRSSPPPVSVAREDGGGIVGAPSSREGIETSAYKIRMVYWPSGFRRRWTDASDFFNKLHGGELADDVFAASQVTYGLLEPIVILERGEDGSYTGYRGVNESMVRSQIMDHLDAPGYYLVFMAYRENLFTGDPSSLSTVEEAKAFVNDPTARFVGDKTVLSAFPILPMAVPNQNLIRPSVVVPMTPLLPSPTIR